MMKTLVSNLLMGVFLVAPSIAGAQGATPMPLEKAVIPDAIAARTLFKYQLSSNLARQIVDACVEFARKQTRRPATTPSSSSLRTATSSTPTSWTAWCRSASRPA